jgi:hypothetical protein
MAGERGRLTDLQIRHWVRAGVPMAKADGGGLTFTLSAGGATGWILRYSHGGRRRELIRDDIAPKVAADAAYQNAKENTPHTARMAHDQALAKVMQHLLKDDTQVYKQFVENESFKRFVGDMVFAITSP